MDNLNLRGLFGTLERFATKHREENSLPAWGDLSMYQEYWDIEAICKNNRVDDAPMKEKQQALYLGEVTRLAEISKVPNLKYLRNCLLI